MIASLLIANRGEIACRVIRTARSMGIRTVAVYSDADAKALHVRQADEAVHIGASPARESYLVGEKIIAAAKATGAEAIHPGYGFLSENADFAQAVIDAGIVWVGPLPDSIRAMGLKDAAKARMIAAGVPVTPGYLGEDQDADVLAAEAEKIGYPILIKAVAGGGGKGMRRVDAAQQFAEMLQLCKREAAASFGDDRVLLEKYVLSPRHIEVQVFGDTHGNVVHLFERDCSLQRRHQKVIEEAPAPGMDEATRDALCAAAVRAAKAVDYVGAGTIEFIADASEGLRADRIWFMEMNTRLQVEHPVTEEITGVDLVEWQLRVASGEPLPKRQDELTINGWAMEARLYAEDPAKGFLPSTGGFTTFSILSGTPADGDRIDAGIDAFSEITPFYDPMIAKLIVKRADRTRAAETLRWLCEDITIAPVKTNAGFLARCLGHPEFVAGAIDTGFIARHEELITGDASMRGPMAAEAGRQIFRNDWTALASPQTVSPAFRLNASLSATARVSGDRGDIHTVDLLRYVDPDWRANFAGDFEPLSGVATIFHAGEAAGFRAYRPVAESGGGAGNGAILSPMPGKIIAVEVAAGDSVTKGQRLLTLEAMKMEHSLTAPFDGVVAELNAVAGAQVQVEALLARIVQSITAAVEE